MQSATELICKIEAMEPQTIAMTDPQTWVWTSFLFFPKEKNMASHQTRVFIHEVKHRLVVLWLLRKLNIELPSDLKFLGMYPK